jgi:hypothetical protein
MARESAKEKRRRLDKLVRREFMKSDGDGFFDGWYISFLKVISYANPEEAGLVKMAQTRMGRIYVSERNGVYSWRAVPEGKSRFPERVFDSASEARRYVEYECSL